jgi:hypothetical protein
MTASRPSLEVGRRCQTAKQVRISIGNRRLYEPGDAYHRWRESASLASQPVGRPQRLLTWIVSVRAACGARDLLVVLDRLVDSSCSFGHKPGSERRGLHAATSELA